jgi:hypothetical protein
LSMLLRFTATEKKRRGPWAAPRFSEFLLSISSIAI